MEANALFPAHDCIARGRELWFERLDFDDLARVLPKYQTGRRGRIVQHCSLSGGNAFGNYQGSTSGMKMSMGQMGRRLLALAVAGVASVTCGSAFAELGQPAPWEFKLQGSATEVMEFITAFHNGLLVVITLITLFVLALLVIVVVRFNARANPVPSRTTHNTLIEVAWTLIPVLILVGISIPSFRLLFLQLDVPKADLTVKATGKQWYWSYAYPDNGKFEFDSLLAQDKQPRLLGVDNEMVVPVNKVIRVQTTGADVIHSFAVPAFGIKIDAIPGRLNETWFKATKTGMFYGQCSELCGKDHSFMPIAVKVVSDQEFAAWVETAKKKFAANPANALASAGAAAQ
jgi:cytochrome c oxidase subunit II